MDALSVQSAAFVPTVIGAIAMMSKWVALRREMLANGYCRNCTALVAPLRGEDVNGNEVPLCRNCYNKLRLKVEYPTSNRAERRARLKTLKKNGDVL